MYHFMEPSELDFPSIAYVKVGVIVPNGDKCVHYFNIGGLWVRVGGRRSVNFEKGALKHVPINY